jgi:hypothetical protein
MSIQYPTTKPDAAVVAKVKAANVQLCEDIHVSWWYHLQPAAAKPGGTALCGARTMVSHATVETWGFKPAHMPTPYCKECELLAINAVDNVNEKGAES